MLQNQNGAFQRKYKKEKEKNRKDVNLLKNTTMSCNFKKQAESCLFNSSDARTFIFTNKYQILQTNLSGHTEQAIHIQNRASYVIQEKLPVVPVVNNSYTASWKDDRVLYTEFQVFLV